MPYPHLEAALDKLLDQYHRLKSPGKYYVHHGEPLAVHYPGMDTFIPTMSLIYLVSLLNDALDEFIQQNQLGPATNLFQKIELLHARGLLADSARLHAIRELRNDCAHDPNKFIRWADFDKCYESIRSELRHLGLVA